MAVAFAFNDTEGFASFDVYKFRFDFDFESGCAIKVVIERPIIAWKEDKYIGEKLDDIEGVVTAFFDDGIHEGLGVEGFADVFALQIEAVFVELWSDDLIAWFWIKERVTAAVDWIG